MSPARSKAGAAESAQQLRDTVVPGGPSDGGMERTQVMAEASSTPKEAGETQVSGPKQVQPAAAKASGGEKSNILGDFKLMRKLGQGGMGAVYLAHQISLDRQCAVKVMSKDLAAKPGFVERFKREAKAMARVEHPNAVRCIAVDEAKGLHFVAMELIDGQSMQDWLDQLGKLSVPDALHVTLLCADALSHAHGMNMIHRDVKPDNILVTKKGGIKVSDFGLAKALDDDMSMTQSGTGLGTPHYMAPEQARNAKHVDHRTDIYALGGTLYHFLTGQTPFKGETIVDLITSKERGSFTPAKRLNPEVPERLDLILDKAMARDPKYRYATMAEFITDLESLQMASDSLSFISSPDREVVRRSGAAGSPLAATRAGFGGKTTSPKIAAIPPSSAEDAERKSSRGLNMDDRWYVKHADSNGRPTVSKWTTSQVLKAMKSNQLDAEARITRDPQQPFLPFAQFPEFSGEAHKLITRTKVKSKEASLANQYAKLEKQYRRQKWWRLLSRFKDGTLGLVGLLLYLAIVAAIIGGVIYGGILLWDFIAAKYNLR